MYLLRLEVSISELIYLIKDINKNRIIDYLKRINNLSLIKRIGYLLEQEKIYIYEEFKDKIMNDKNYIVLEQKLPKSDEINKKWRININIKIKK